MEERRVSTIDTGILRYAQNDTCKSKNLKELLLQCNKPKSISLPNIESSIAYLNSFAPQGPGNIEYVVLQAINNLAGREDVQEIIVITSGLDESGSTPLKRGGG